MIDMFWDRSAKLCGAGLRIVLRPLGAPSAASTACVFVRRAPLRALVPSVERGHCWSSPRPFIITPTRDWVALWRSFHDGAAVWFWVFFFCLFFSVFLFFVFRF